MFTGPVGPVEVFFYCPEAVFWKFLLACVHRFTLSVEPWLIRPGEVKMLSLNRGGLLKEVVATAGLTVVSLNGFKKCMKSYWKKCLSSRFLGLDHVFKK